MSKPAASKKPTCDGCEVVVPVDLGEDDPKLVLFVCEKCRAMQRPVLFQHKRYLSAGIHASMTPDECVAVFGELDRRIATYGENLSYLQAFRVLGKDIWVIDDGAVTTMLLPDEY